MGVPLLFANLIPSEFRPLLSAVSPVAFLVVEWKQVLRDAPVLMKRVTTHEGVEGLSNQLSSLWPRPIVAKKKSLGKQEELSTEASKIALGQAALELYFAQIFNNHGLFLDLRRRNFLVDANGVVSFAPNGFWIQWDQAFREGLLNIYIGYYENRADPLNLGLEQIGLINAEMPPDKVAEIKAMLLAHIGGDFKQQRFLISDFTKSFERFFQFLLANRIKLSADFLYLGLYLASLYDCLNDVGGVYDVQSLFLKAKNYANTL